MAKDAGSAVIETAGDAMEGAKDMAGKVADKAGDIVEGAVDMAKDAGSYRNSRRCDGRG